MIRMLEKYAKFSSVLLRVGIAVTFVAFGVDKFVHPSVWINWIPPRVLFYVPFSSQVFIYVQGAAESLIGLAIFFGFFTRVAALIAGLLMLGIVVALGLNDITLRDVSTMMACFALALTGSSVWSVDARMRWKKQRREPEEIILE